jgi:hypothetical protein
VITYEWIESLKIKLSLPKLYHGALNTQNYLDRFKCSQCSSKAVEFITTKRKEPIFTEPITIVPGWPKKTCSACGGDGGAGGRCYKCDGTGWEELSF